MGVLAALVKPQFAVGLVIIGVVLLRRHLLRPGSGPVPEVRGRLADLDRRLAGWFTRRQGFGRLVSTGVFAALVGVVVILPLDLPARAPNDLAGVPILGHIAGLLAIVWSSAEHYAVLTVNAFNPWALVGPNPLSQALSGEYGWPARAGHLGRHGHAPQTRRPLDDRPRVDGSRLRVLRAADARS
jgi:hypothetical protein